MDFVHYWSERTGLRIAQFARWLGIGRSKFYDWRERYGKANEHNAFVPRDHWISEEKLAIIDFYAKNPLHGYRRLAFMMIDRDVVYVSPTTVNNVLRGAGLIDQRSIKKSKKGQGFQQPDGVHLHWHVDISYINVEGNFYYLCSVLDGYSRYLVHWSLRESMTEAEVEFTITTDNGPQFIVKDFKKYARLYGLSYVRMAPYYPQSNGKIERWHGELKRECIRPASINTYMDASKAVERFVEG